MPHVPTAFALAWLTACGEASPPDAATTTERPNFVVIDVDSLRADRIGRRTPEGASLTPHIDALAERGTTFTQAWSNAGWTLPGITSLLTGRYPVPTQGDVRAVPLLHADGHPLPDILARYGYQAHAVWRGGELEVFRSVGLFPSQDFGGDGAPEALLADATRWLRAQERAPFFLFVHQFNLAHQEDLNRPPAGPGHPEEAIRRYDALVNRYDTVVGGIVDTLAQLGHDDDTVIVLTSDHGMDLAEHRPVLTVSSLNDSDLHIPLVIVDPARPNAPRGVDATVQGIDLAPTLLARAGIPLDVRMDGRSVLPLLDDAAAPWEDRPVFGLVHADYVSMRTRAEKWVLEPAGGAAALRARHLDLRADPGERAPRWVPDPSREAGLAPLLAWRRTLTTRPEDTRFGAYGEAGVRFLQEHGYFGTIEEPRASGPVPASGPRSP
jgi:arylsulfatase A-like enzyme